MHLDCLKVELLSGSRPITSVAIVPSSHPVNHIHPFPLALPFTPRSPTAHGHGGWWVNGHVSLSVLSLLTVSRPAQHRSPACFTLNRCGHAINICARRLNHWVCVITVKSMGCIENVNIGWIFYLIGHVTVICHVPLTGKRSKGGKRFILTLLPRCMSLLLSYTRCPICGTYTQRPIKGIVHPKM